MSARFKGTVLAISVGLFCVLAVLACRTDLQPLNDRFARAVQSLESPPLTAVMKLVSSLGEWYVYIPVALGLMVLPQTRLRIGLPSAAALTVSWMLNELLKGAFALPRPIAHRLVNAAGYSFPSGHAMIGTAFIGVCACLFAWTMTSRRAKTVLFALAALFLILVGFSRIYLGVHNPFDVAAGHLAGIAICSLTLLIVQKETANRVGGKPC